MRCEGSLYLVKGGDQVRSELDLSEEGMRHAIDAIPTIVFVTGRDRRLEYVNSRYAEFRGAPRDEVLRQRWEETIHPADLEGVLDAIRHSASSGTPYAVEQRVRDARGVYRWLLVHGNPSHAADGSVARWFGTATDIDEFKRAQAQLDALLEGAPVGIAVFDRDYRYVRANRALADMQGTTTEKLLGRKLADVAPSMAVAMEPLFAQVMETGEPLTNYELAGEAVTPGDPRHFLVSYYPIKVENETVGLAALINDISTRKRVEHALRLLARAGDVLTSSLDLDATVNAALRLLVPEAATAALVHLADDGVLTQSGVFAAHADPKLELELLEMWKRFPPDAANPLARVLSSRTPELLEMSDDYLRGMAQSDEHLVALRSFEMRSVVVVPLVAHGRALGALALGSKGRDYDELEVELAVELGRRIGAAVENGRLFQVAERRGAQLERLQTFTAALAAVRTLSEVVDVILTRGRPAFQAERAVVALLARDGQALEVLRAAGYPPERIAPFKALPLARSLPLTDAARDGRPLFFANRAELVVKYPALHESPGPHSNAIVALPLLTHTRPLGSLGLEMDRARTFNPEEEADLMAFAWMCSQAIERALLFDLAESERKRAEDANRMKDDFLAVLSHEIRTPLNAIMGWAKMLSTRTLDQAQSDRAVAIIERNARAQAQLVDDLLDVSRIVTGKLKLSVEEVEIVRVVEAAADVVRPAAAAKDVKIDIAIDERASRIMGDAARLQQIIWNLLSNAVKFTEKKGSVTLSTSLEDDSCVISVEDSGQGIEPDFLPHIFERFRQADMGTARAHGGLGLGLAIVRHLVELHGGRVEAFSEGLGRGSRFVVRLPLAPTLRTPSPLPPPLDWTQQPGAVALGREMEGLRVLVVDDEPDARDLVAALLAQCKIVVTVAAGAAEALAILARDRPDVLVSDIGMPGDDGFSLVRNVRRLADDEGGRTPAVALTAYARNEDRTKALLAGFDAHVPKPVDPSELLVAIAHVSGRLDSGRKSADD